MTLPDERYRALRCGLEFLCDLTNPKKTPKVPKEIRKRAFSILKHYPRTYHFEMIAEALPDEFEKTNSFLKLIVDNEAKNDTR